MKFRLSLFSIILIAVIFSISNLIISCGESEENRKTRQAVSLLSQRFYSISQDYSTWIQNKDDRNDTWKDAFDKHDKTVSELESIAHDLNSIVPTKKYFAVTSALRKAVGFEIDYVKAKKNAINQTFIANNSLNRATEYHNEGMTSDYGYKTYFAMADKARGEATEAFEQAKNFDKSTVSLAEKLRSYSDTLRALVIKLELLPDPGNLSYPLGILEVDSLIIGSEKPINVSY